MSEQTKNFTRREFVTGVGGVGVGLAIGGFTVKGFLLPDEVFAVPASEGYLLVDTKKCSGCTSCMLACSLAHSGQSNLSLSRIQVVNNVFTAFPAGIEQATCRQCPYPACVDACPTGANHVDAANGNVRTIDEEKCIGCERCIEACPFTPSRVQWNPLEKAGQKCDLCSDTPYWNQEGGPDGKQACIANCAMHAITFTKDIPVQSDSGYKVNLRKNDPLWAKFAFADGDNGEITYQVGAISGGV